MSATNHLGNSKFKGYASTELMNQIVSRENMTKAYERVLINKGSPGVDGLSVLDLKDYLQSNWSRIKVSLLSDNYQPRAVKKVVIPKPKGGERILGIPTVLDRLIQQGIHQVLSPIYDPSFSESSYGFRPNRSAQEAVQKAKDYITKGKRWVVDMDLSKFFDEVHHERLLSKLSLRIEDRRVVHLIERYLRAGMIGDGVEEQRKKGTPQGSPLSPLLSNIVLDELDKELEKRGHCFVRFKNKVKAKMRMGKGRNQQQFIHQDLNPLLKGWMIYFSGSDVKGFGVELDSWIRRHLRKNKWRQWKRSWTRREALMKRGLSEENAIQSSFNQRGAWWNAGARHMNFAYPVKYFDQCGLVSLEKTHSQYHLFINSRNRRDT